MASQKTKFTVGLFVAGGIAFVLLAIIWLGMSRFFEKGQYYVTYFNESVQGLDLESPVKYRGVSIGRVIKIGVAPDSRLIEVVLKVESGQSLDGNIVAQLKSVGITGSMFLELDRKKENEPDRSPSLSFPSENPIVASKPSDISELVRGIDDVLNQIRSLDLKGISDKVILNLDDVNQMIRDANVKGLSEGMAHILDSHRWDKIMGLVEKAVGSFDVLTNKAGVGLDRVEGVVKDNEEEIGLVVRDFRTAMEKVNVLLDQGSSLVNGTGDLQSNLKRHMLVVARNLEKASENLERLIDLLADQPSQLMFGQPPAPRQVELETR
ncbi:MAG: MCE family protein [Deltaproteobacteria bacterium]|nr:MCE family protein [Deltaproteobacteria bacterium]